MSLEMKSINKNRPCSSGDVEGRERSSSGSVLQRRASNKGSKYRQDEFVMLSRVCVDGMWNECTGDIGRGQGTRSLRCILLVCSLREVCVVSCGTSVFYCL